METLDRSHDIDSTVMHPARIVRPDGLESQETGDVQAEHTLDVYVDGKLSMRIVCTPTNLTELVCGRLFTEGVIDSADDIDLIYLCEYSTKARVLLKRKRAELSEVPSLVVPTCCTGNKVYATLERIEGEEPELAPVTPMPWKPEWVFSLARLFAEDTPMHRKTFGAHSCFLAVAGKLLYCCEDLGRHNAFDKVIGCALRDDVDLSQSIIYTSGRLPVDMVTKAIRARIPILASKAVPTDLTIELARRFDLTLICSARPDSMRIYHDPTRPIDTPEEPVHWKVSRLLDADAPGPVEP